VPKIIIILLILSIIAVFAFSYLKKQNISDNIKVDVKIENSVTEENQSKDQTPKQVNDKQVSEQDEVCKKNDKCTDPTDSNESTIYKKYF
jgi:uncharacterized protein YxeA